MAKLFDRVGQATATTGTGTVTLGAVITDATNGDLATFTDMGAVAGDSVNYLIVDGNNWEIGTGALGGTAPGFTLSRTVAKSKIAGTVGITALTLSGTAKVYSVPANAVPNLWVMPSLGHDGSGVQLRLTNPAGTQSNALFSYGGLNLGDQVPINWGSSYQTANTGWDIGFSRNSLARTLFLDAQGGTGNRGDLILGNGYFYGGRTYDATNYSRLSLSHAGGTAGATIATEAGGTGTAGPITISVPGGGFVKVRADGYTEVVALKSDTINASAFDLRTTGFKLDGTIAVTWGASYGTPDVGLYRTAPGVVEVNNGTAGTYRAIKAACFIQAQGTLTSGATVAWDVQANQSAILTLGVNATLSNPTNMVAGTTYMLVVKQDATGSRTLAYGTAYKWPGGAAPVLSTAANATDVLTFIYDGTSMLGVAQKAFA